MPICLFVINSLGGGGAERVFARLVNLLNARNDGFEVVVVTLDVESIENPIDKSITHIQLDCSGSMIKSMNKINRVIRWINPTVVVSFLTRANIAAVWACKYKKIPVIVSERTTNRFGDSLSSWFKSKLLRYFYNRADMVVAVSEGVKRNLVNLYDINSGKIKIIGNSYSKDDLENRANEYTPEFETGSYIVCVGRFAKSKNQQILVRAMKNVKTSKKLVFLGDGPEILNVKKLVCELNLENRIIFKGFIRNPYPYIKGSCGLVSGSLIEGFPNVIAEALTLGKFVVSSDCQSGPAELLNTEWSEGVTQLTYGQYGVLIPVNDVHATADALELFSNSAVLSDYEQRVQSIASRFSHQVFVDSFLSTILKCV